MSVVNGQVFDAIIAEVCRNGKPVNTLTIIISAEANLSMAVSDLVALSHRFRSVVVTNALAGKQFVIREPRPLILGAVSALFQAPQGAKPPALQTVKWPDSYQPTKPLPPTYPE